MTRRLLVSYLLVTALVLVLLEVPLAVFYAQRERERIAADVEHDASVIATFYEDDLEGDAAPRLRTGRPSTATAPERGSSSSTATASPGSTPTRPSIATSPPVQRSQLALAGNTAEGTRSSETLETDLLYVAVPVASGGVVHGAVRVTLDTSDVNARIHRFWRSGSPPSLQSSSSSSPSSGGGLPGPSPDRFDDSTAPPHGSPAATSPSALSRSTARPRCGHSPTRCPRWHDVSTSCCEANAPSSPMPPTSCAPHSPHCASASRTCRAASPRSPQPSSTPRSTRPTRLAALVNGLLQLARADEHPATRRRRPRTPHDRPRRHVDRRRRSQRQSALIADTPPSSVLVEADPARHRTDPRQPPRQRAQRIAPRVHDHRPHHVPRDHPRPDNQRPRPRASRRREAPGNPPILAREHHHVRHRTRPRHRRLPRHRIPRQDPPRRCARRRPRRHRLIRRRQPGNGQPMTPRPEIDQRASGERLPSTPSSPAPRGVRRCSQLRHQESVGLPPNRGGLLIVD